MEKLIESRWEKFRLSEGKQKATLGSAIFHSFLSSTAELFVGPPFVNGFYFYESSVYGISFTYLLFLRAELCISELVKIAFLNRLFVGHDWSSFLARQILTRIHLIFTTPQVALAPRDYHLAKAWRAIWIRTNRLTQYSHRYKLKNCLVNFTLHWSLIDEYLICWQAHCWFESILFFYPIIGFCFRSFCDVLNILIYEISYPIVSNFYVKATNLGQSTVCAVWNSFNKVQLWNATNALNCINNLDSDAKILRKSLDEKPLMSFESSIDGYGISWSSLKTGLLKLIY